MGTCSKASRSVAAVVSFLLVVSTASCGVLGNSKTASSKKNGSSGGSATTLAPATGPALDLVATRAALEQLPAFEGVMDVTVNDGNGDIKVSSAHLTVVQATGRVRVESHATEAVPTAYTSVSDGNDLYVKGSDQWTKMTVDASLLGPAPGKTQATSIVDMIEKTGAELRQDSTTATAGQTSTKYRAKVDGEKLWEVLTSNAAMSQLGSKMPTPSDMVGSMRVEVDKSGLIRVMWIDLSFVADGEQVSMRVYMTRDPLPADTTIDLPAADQITETKSITTADEMGTAMQAAIS